MYGVPSLMFPSAPPSQFGLSRGLWTGAPEGGTHYFHLPRVRRTQLEVIKQRVDKQLLAPPLVPLGIHYLVDGLTGRSRGRTARAWP